MYLEKRLPGVPRQQLFSHTEPPAATFVGKQNRIFARLDRPRVKY
jgi:hypothetical protein